MTEMTEASARRNLNALGYDLRKNRSRTPELPGYGGYMIFQKNSISVAAGTHPIDYALDLGGVAAFIAQHARTPGPPNSRGRLGRFFDQVEKSSRTK